MRIYFNFHAHVVSVSVRGVSEIRTTSNAAAKEPRGRRAGRSRERGGWGGEIYTALCVCYPPFARERERERERAEVPRNEESQCGEERVRARRGRTVSGTYMRARGENSDKYIEVFPRN